MPSENPSPICVIGDVHGHLQLALAMTASWQAERAAPFEAVFLCGDVGTFTSDAQLDSTTRRHGKANPCELEFLTQWSATPFPQWLAMVFAPLSDDGLGLTCPIVMVHGNHEGFSHLATLAPQVPADEIVEIGQLPAIDTGGFLRYLPNGCRCRTASGKVVAGVGGIEIGQRNADYHPLAYLDEAAILRLLELPASDMLITHQGPAKLQRDGGATDLDLLLEAGKARVWCHGHSIRQPGIVDISGVRVVPMEDATFTKNTDDPGDACLAAIHFDAPDTPPRVELGRPADWRIFRKNKWLVLDETRLVCPPLAKFAAMHGRK